MPEYNASYPEGTTVRVADRATLEHFMATWKYHHPLTPDRLQYADKTSRVKKVGYYHGGDVLYELDDVPGIWHEECLRKA
jgi:hypothetical protein